MRVLFIINRLHTGGAEIQLLKLLEKIDSSFQVSVITLSTLGEIGEQIRFMGVKVEALGINKKRPWRLLSLIKHIKIFKPDIIHTWMYHSNLIGGLAGLLTGYKNIIWSIHHNDLSYKLNKRMTIYVAKAGAYLSRIMSVRIVCVSQKVKETHIAFGYNPTSLIVIENGIDTSQFQKLPLAKIEIANELKVDPNITFIGLFGRYDPIKNHAGFLFEIARIKSEEWFKNVHVLLAGPDISHNNQQLTKVITEHGLGSIVHLLGVRNDMPQLMSSLDILVNASFNESFSLVLAEAMSCEIPCITTIEGDPSSIIGGYGYSFPVLKFSDLSVALEYHLTLPEIDRINIGKGARSRIIDLFDLARVVTKYEVLYNSFKASVG